MSQSTYLTYYQRNKEIISTKNKEYYKKKQRQTKHTRKRQISQLV